MAGAPDARDGGSSLASRTISAMPTGTLMKKMTRHGQ
jgi:hypothetical protein